MNFVHVSRLNHKDEKKHEEEHVVLMYLHYPGCTLCLCISTPNPCTRRRYYFHVFLGYHLVLTARPAVDCSAMMCN